MKRTIPDQAANDRLERLLDEDLRAIVQAPPVDLRAKVLQALERLPAARPEAPGTAVERPGGSAVEPGFSRILRPRWAFALAGAAALLVAVFLATQTGIRPAPERLTARVEPLGSAPLVAGKWVAPAAALPSSVAPSRAPVATAFASVRRAESPTVPLDEPAPGPYLPGAPMGELGDPLQPMPSPPPIAFAPIEAAPPVSQDARPVTDFPADNPAPAAPAGTAGRSGGTRR